MRLRALQRPAPLSVHDQRSSGAIVRNRRPRHSSPGRFLEPSRQAAGTPLMRFPIPLQHTQAALRCPGQPVTGRSRFGVGHTLAVFRLAPTPRASTPRWPGVSRPFVPRALRRGRRRLLAARSNACGVPSPRPALWRGPARTTMRLNRSGGAHGVHTLRSVVPVRASAMVLSTTHTPPAVSKTSASMIFVEGPVAEFVIMLCDRPRDIRRGSWVFPRGQSAPHRMTMRPKLPWVFPLPGLQTPSMARQRGHFPFRQPSAAGFRFRPHPFTSLGGA